MRCVLHLVLTAVITCPAGSAAQQDPRLAPGARVRVWLETCFGCGRSPGATGTLVALGPDSLVLAVGDGVAWSAWSAPLTRITRLDVSRGRGGSAMGRGAAIGAGAGALVGAVVGASSYQEPECTPDAMFCGLMDWGPGASAIGGSIVMGLAGALLGAAVGSRLPGPERWATIPGKRVRLVATGRRGGPILMASLRF